MIDGICFANKREANRYAELALELRAGLICNLERQVTFRLSINGVHICDYRADFVYERNGEVIVEDSKGARTKEYKLKRALMLALKGIKILET